MEYKAVVFDLDGTLLDSLEDLADAMNLVLVDFGFPQHPYDAYRFFVGRGIRNLAKNAAPAGTHDTVLEKMVAVMGEKYAANWANKSCPYPGIMELLSGLQQRGLPLSVLSNKPDPFTQIIVEHFFPKEMFAIVAGSKDSVPRKPDPSAALQLAEVLELPPAAIIYVGDSDVDMKTGRRAGMFTIGVAWGFRPVEELIEFGAQAIVDHPAEVLQFFQDE